MDSVRLKIAEGVHIPFNKDLMLNIMLCVAWAPVLLHFSRGIFVRLPFIGEERVDIAIAASVVLSVICALPALINRFSLLDYLFYTLCSFYLLSAYVFFPENETFLDENVPICIFCVFTYYFVGRLIDIERMFSLLVFLSTICIFANLFYYFILSSTLEKFRIWKAFTTLIGILFLLACGTRGPFVCMGSFGLIYFFFYMNFKGAIYVKTGIVTLFALLIATFNTTLYYITFLFTNLNLSTRILEHVVTGELGNDNSRTVLRERLEEVMENVDQFWGLGPFGCRNYDIIYPHFLPLDFAVTFGYFVGYILLFLLTVLVVYALWLSRGSKRQVFIIFLISLGILKLFLSNTFLTEPFFFMLIGVCITEIINHARTHYIL